MQKYVTRCLRVNFTTHRVIAALSALLKSIWADIIQLYVSNQLSRVVIEAVKIILEL